MADQRDRKRGDELPQDGLGRDAAHGGSTHDTTGGSYGRSTGRAGDDLSASSSDASGDESSRTDDASARRQGLEGRGFDAGTGYGGGGNASAYRQGSGMGGQSASGGAQIPRGTDEQSGQMDRDGRQAGGSDDADAIDPDATPEVRRRDPSH